MRLVILLAGACAHRAAPRTTFVGTGSYDGAGADGVWAPDPDHVLLPTGRWVRLGDVLAYIYFDGSEGLSAQWRDDRMHVRRLAWAPAGLAVLGDDERAALSLPEVPDWIGGYGPQPPLGTPYGGWRDDPALAARFHPDWPDDLRVVVGDEQGYDLLWVRIRACEGSQCEGVLLNQPDRAKGLSIGSTVAFDGAGAPADRPLVAAPPGEAPSRELFALVASRPEFSDALQEDAAWAPDGPHDAAHLVPIGTWGRVGQDLAYFFLGPNGPVAAILSPGASHPSFLSLTWVPAGFAPLSAEERAAVGLPVALDVGGAPPQPPQGPWGGWLVEPATAWLFQRGDNSLGVAIGDDAATMRVLGCDAMRCWGVLDAGAAGLAAGAAVDIVYLLPPDVDRASFVPVAAPAGQR